MDVLIGCVAIVFSLVTMSVLVFWSRRRINRIGQHGSLSAREVSRGVERE